MPLVCTYVIGPSAIVFCIGVICFGATTCCMTVTNTFLFLQPHSSQDFELHVHAVAREADNAVLIRHSLQKSQAAYRRACSSALSYCRKHMFVDRKIPHAFVAQVLLLGLVFLSTELHNLGCSRYSCLQASPSWYG